MANTNTFFQRIRALGDASLVKSINVWVRKTIALGRILAQRSFLRTCRQGRVFPVSITSFIQRFRRRFGLPQSFLFKNLQQRILNSYISCTYSREKVVVRDLNFWKQRVRRNNILATDPGFWDELLDIVCQKFYYAKHSNQQHLEEKYRVLFMQKYGRDPDSLWPNPEIAADMVTNLSTAQFSQQELEILALGPKFALPNKKPPIFDWIFKMNFAFKRLLKSDFRFPVEKVQRLVSANLRHMAKDLPFQPLPPWFQATYRKLRKKINQQELSILKADKGGGTVVMDRAAYFQKMKDFFLDTTYYEKATQNKYKTYHDKVKSLLQKSLQEEDVGKHLLSVDRGPLPVPYAVVKVHKQHHPLRVIVPGFSNVSYWVSKELDQILKPISMHLPFRVKSSTEVLACLQRINWMPTHFLASLDATHLFDNVQISEFLDILKPALELGEQIGESWRDTASWLGHVMVEDLLDLFKLVLHGCYFKFGDQVWHQKTGVAMGSPTSVAVADIWFHGWETRYLEALPDILKPVLYVRFVDDILVVFNIQEFLMSENIPSELYWFSPQPIQQRFMDGVLFYIHNLTRPSKLLLTHELESNGNLAFLDIDIQRSDWSMATGVFHKSTAAHRYQHPASFAPSTYRRATLKTMWCRANALCSTPQSLEKELTHLDLVFRHKHGYKQSEFDRVTIPTCRPPPIQWKLTMAVPYHGRYSNRLKRILGEFGIRIAHGPALTIHESMFANTRQPIPKTAMDLMNVVYWLGCEDCSNWYIGETVRPLRKRVSEHKDAVKSKTKTLQELSAISKHAKLEQHSIGSAAILAKGAHQSDIELLEMLFITANKCRTDVLNDKTKLGEFPGGWHTLKEFFLVDPNSLRNS